MESAHHVARSSARSGMKSPSTAAWRIFYMVLSQLSRSTSQATLREELALGFVSLWSSLHRRSKSRITTPYECIIDTSTRKQFMSQVLLGW